jgi:hypothetical protein
MFIKVYKKDKHHTKLTKTKTLVENYWPVVAATNPATGNKQRRRRQRGRRRIVWKCLTNKLMESAEIPYDK